MLYVDSIGQNDLTLGWVTLGCVGLSKTCHMCQKLVPWIEFRNLALISGVGFCSIMHLD